MKSHTITYHLYWWLSQRLTACRQAQCQLLWRCEVICYLFHVEYSWKSWLSWHFAVFVILETWVWTPVCAMGFWYFCLILYYMPITYHYIPLPLHALHTITITCITYHYHYMYYILLHIVTCITCITYYYMHYLILLLVTCITFITYHYVPLHVITQTSHVIHSFCDHFIAQVLTYHSRLPSPLSAAESHFPPG